LFGDLRLWKEKLRGGKNVNAGEKEGDHMGKEGEWLAHKRAGKKIPDEVGGSLRTRKEKVWDELWARRRRTIIGKPFDLAWTISASRREEAHVREKEGSAPDGNIADRRRRTEEFVLSGSQQGARHRGH